MGTRIQYNEREGGPRERRERERRKAEGRKTFLRVTLALHRGPFVEVLRFYLMLCAMNRDGRDRGLPDH